MLTADARLFALTPRPNPRSYGWSGCIDATHPFTRPASLDKDYGEPLNFCSETAPGSQIWTRNYTKLDLSIDCRSYEATYIMK